MKGNTSFVVTAIVLLFAVLLISRMYPLREGFQTKKEDVCNVLKKGRTDINSQLDQANALMTDANSQLAKIKASLDDVTKLSQSFDC
jgi:hypothetical protein